jgi:hypothetical protein
MAIVDLVVSSLAGEQSRAVPEEEEVGAEHAIVKPYCLNNGVRQLSDCGITRLPDSYVLPPSDRPDDGLCLTKIKLPVVDLARLRNPGERAAVLETLDAACRDYGFFQVPHVCTCMHIYISLIPIDIQAAMLYCILLYIYIYRW